jgi:hypothetical protein
MKTINIKKVIKEIEQTGFFHLADIKYYNLKQEWIQLIIKIIKSHIQIQEKCLYKDVRYCKYITGCGVLTSFYDKRYKDKLKYCPYCGKKIKVVEERL